MLHAGREFLGYAWDGSDLIAASGDDDLVGGEIAVGGAQFKAAIAAAPGEPFHGGAFHYGWAEGFGVGLDVFDDLLFHHEAVRVRPGIGKAGELALPVGRHQAEGVPALGAPGLGDAMFFEDDVVDAALFQAPTHGQAGLAAADDDDWDNECGVRRVEDGKESMDVRSDMEYGFGRCRPGRSCG